MNLGTFAVQIAKANEQFSDAYLLSYRLTLEQIVFYPKPTITEIDRDRDMDTKKDRGEKVDHMAILKVRRYLSAHLPVAVTLAYQALLI